VTEVLNTLSIVGCQEENIQMPALMLQAAFN